MPPSERRPRAGIQRRRGQIPCPPCQKPSATGFRCHCQPFSGQELRLISPDERIWTGSHGSQEQLGGTEPAPWRATAKPEVGTAGVPRPCPFPFPPCLFRQSAGMPASIRKGLNKQKNPRQLCFSAALLMTRWPPVNTIKSKGGYKGHVGRTQLPRLQREMQNHWQILV